jgi:hypothetical protein
LRNVISEDCECYPELTTLNKLRRKASATVEFLLKLMRIRHAILGITLAEPEDERRLLLLWIVSLALIIAFAVAVFVFLLLRIMR